MKPIKSFEPIAAQSINAIAKSLGNIGAMVAGLGEIDTAAGAGIIDNNTKCVWTYDGHRIEVWLGEAGSFGASKSKEIDPDKPAT